MRENFYSELEKVTPPAECGFFLDENNFCIFVRSFSARTFKVLFLFATSVANQNALIEELARRAREENFEAIQIWPDDVRFAETLGDFAEIEKRQNIASIPIFNGPGEWVGVSQWDWI